MTLPKPISVNVSLYVSVKQDSGSVPKVACINCSLEIPVTLVREHLAACCNGDDL